MVHGPALPLNQIVTDYSPDGITFLPTPLLNVQGLLHDCIRPRPNALAHIGDGLDAALDYGRTTVDFRALDIWHTPAGGWAAPGPNSPPFTLALHGITNLVLPPAGLFVGPLFPPPLRALTRPLGPLDGLDPCDDGFSDGDTSDDQNDPDEEFDDQAFM